MPLVVPIRPAAIEPLPGAYPACPGPIRWVRRGNPLQSVKPIKGALERLSLRKREQGLHDGLAAVDQPRVARVALAQIGQVLVGRIRRWGEAIHKIERQPRSSSS